MAAGYGSRLQRDINNDESGAFSHLLGIAKALLPLNGIPLVNYWLKLFQSSSSSKEDEDIKQEFDTSNFSNLTDDLDAFIICNDANHDQFLNWAKLYSFPVERIFNDGSTSNEARLGAVSDLSLAINPFGLKHDTYRGVLVVAGDTLFLEDFNISNFLNLAYSIAPSCLVTSYKVSDNDTYKTGILELDDKSNTSSPDKLLKVKRLIEKPGPLAIASREACPCFYYFSSECLPLIDVFLQRSKELKLPLEEIDATGKLISWLVQEYPFYASHISGRLDIGGLLSYQDAEKYISIKN